MRSYEKKIVYRIYLLGGNGILSPQVNFVAKLDLPCAWAWSNKAVWGGWPVGQHGQLIKNLLTYLLFWGMFICTCIKYGLRCFCLFPF